MDSLRSVPLNIVRMTSIQENRVGQVMFYSERDQPPSYFEVMNGSFDRRDEHIHRYANNGHVTQQTYQNLLEDYWHILPGETVLLADLEKQGSGSSNRFKCAWKFDSGTVCRFVLYTFAFIIFLTALYSNYYYD